jgi:predicted metalloendopeptidase
MPTPAASADTVIAFETEIAKGHWTPEQLRVPDQAFKAMDAAAFQALVPNIDIKAFAAGGRRLKPVEHGRLRRHGHHGRRQAGRHPDA